MYKNIMGQKRKYYYRMTVKSLEELDNLRYKNDCAFINRKDLKVFKSKCMPCTRKRDGKGCDFELMAFRPEFNNDTIHVYAYSEHNHPFQTERRWFSKKSTELIPDANPPKIFRTSNNVEWKFHKTIADYETMETIRRQNQCKSIKSAGAKWRLHYCCTRKYYVNRCKFTLLAMKTNQQRYHVYKHGKHNHVPMKRIINQKLLMANRQKNIISRNEQMDDVDEDNNEDEDEEEAEREEEEDDTEGEEKEEEEEENDEENDEQPQQEQQKPLGKISKNIRGQQRDYYYRKTVKSMEELDKFCFNNYCNYVSAGKPSHILESLLIPCTAKNKKECDFELLALRPQLGGVTIHVYAHSEHNHSIKSTEMRLHNRGKKQLMPDANAPLIFHTADSIEWKFLQTFPDYGQLQKFRLKNRCKSQGNDKYWRVRYVCQRKFHKNKCQFVLLALKTIKQRYHVYRHCEHEHNHAVWKPSKRQRTAKGKKLDQQRRMQAEEEEDEDEEEEEWKEESDEESEEEETEENSEEEDEEEIVEEEEQLKMEAKYEPIEEKNEQEERSMEDIKIVEIIENSRTHAERLKEKLAKANGKVYKWMDGIEPNEIGQTIEEWDKLSLLKMVEMADQEIREHPQKLNLWLSWLKCAIPKCAPQIEGFNVRFANLIKLAFD